MSISRRHFLKLSGTTLAVLAAGLEVAVPKLHAAGRKLKLKDAKEVPNVCHFCSGGCGLILHVRNDEIVNLEGDPDHPTNKGSLCPKGAALSQVRKNPQRVTKPKYRAPGSKEWKEISWEEATDKIAAKIKHVRDASWVPAANRTDAIGALGSAEIDNEECYILTKFIRTIGSNLNEHQARV